MTFHLKDGFCFERMVDGRIALRVEKEGAVIAETIVDESGFASVVASVSKRGETGETYREALAFLEAEA